jgi:hypothetical protein
MASNRTGCSGFSSRSDAVRDRRPVSASACPLIAASLWYSRRVMAQAADLDTFERILEYLRQTRGFDFTAYKRSSLLRRVLKRMQLIDIHDFEQYLDYLQVYPDEFAALFNTIAP